MYSGKHTAAMPESAPVTASTDPVEAVRRFSRYYTRRIGLLDEGLLRSPFSLTEARVIWELAHRPGVAASELASSLGVDAGYLSRVLRGLRRRGVVERRRAPDDGRKFLLGLAAGGRAAFRKLDAASRAQIEGLLDPLPTGDRERLVAAMDAVATLLDGRADERVPYVLRPPRPGDLGWVVQSHGRLYAEEHGFDERFEATTAEIVARFVRDLDPRRERCWIAEREGRNVGSVFVVARAAEAAQLRCLLVEPEARGLGIGRRLVQECVRFARDVGYSRMMLWTVDILHAARRIYENEGFTLRAEEPFDGFGPSLVSQTWERPL